MRQVFLLALNTLREQKLILFLILFWVAVFTVLLSIDRSSAMRQELETFFRQELLYGIIIAMFSAASAVHNERRSRRILAVLSKGISRRQYLLGHLLAIALLSAVYYGAIGASNLWLTRWHAMEAELAGPLAVAFLGSQLAACIGLPCGVVLHPLAAAIVAGLFLSAPVGMARLLGDGTLRLFPASFALRDASQATYLTSWNGDALFLGALISQWAAAFALALWLFRKRDVTLPVD